MPIVILFIMSFQFAFANCEHDAKNFRCVEFVKNYDADTVTFNIKGIHPLLGQKINVRVVGVDTPEIRTQNKCEKNKARDAQKLVANLLKNAKRIDLVNVERDKYFRILAEVVIDGKSLSDYLLKNGLAYSYFGKTKRKMDWCRPARDIAAENKL